MDYRVLEPHRPPAAASAPCLRPGSGGQPFRQVLQVLGHVWSRGRRHQKSELGCRPVSTPLQFRDHTPHTRGSQAVVLQGERAPEVRSSLNPPSRLKEDPNLAARNAHPEVPPPPGTLPSRGGFVSAGRQSPSPFSSAHFQNGVRKEVCRVATSAWSSSQDAGATSGPVARWLPPSANFQLVSGASGSRSRSRTGMLRRPSGPGSGREARAEAAG